MSKVVLSTEEIQKYKPCKKGIEYFAAIFPKGFEVEYTPFHAIWLRVIFGGHCVWAQRNNLIPKLDLSLLNLEGLDLHSVDLSEASITNANLRSCNLRHASFRYTNLSDSDLSNSDIRNVEFDTTNIVGVNFEGAYRNVNDAPIDGWDLICTGRSGSWRAKLKKKPSE